jgi:hypothetical protein
MRKDPAVRAGSEAAMAGEEEEGMKLTAEQERQLAAFKRQRGYWRAEITRQVGKDKMDFFIGVCRGVVASWAPGPEREFQKFLRVTGAGDHPMYLRLLYNVARFLDPELPEIPARRKRILKRKRRR